ncbi:MarR family winged helix-turn-helix transcriptional regulator [Nocardia noduli]|uniref:MarR family winged helix-turn-helix transcriptional regulator n=1 Tax=Nocardia noduli TaxID=2815722 RepID=UPI001C2115CA|nr:MarR family winged helix-turn-helix transcriptional regulator [Nocardia noduli]
MESADSSDEASNNEIPKAPLGYVVKLLDAALTGYVDKLLGQRYQLGRGHWQVLRTISAYPGLDFARLADSARAFFEEAELRKLVDDLVERGWVVVADGKGALSLTEDGSAGFRAMERTQNGSSAILRRGISAAEYESVLNLMFTMINNIENTDPMDPTIP